MSSVDLQQVVAGQEGASISGPLLAALLEPVADGVVDDVEQTEAALLADAVSQLPGPGAPTTTPPPTTAPAGFRSRQPTAGGGAMPVIALLLEIGNGIAGSKTAGTVSTSTPAPTSSATGGGRLESFSLGTDGAGSVSASLSMTIEVTASDGSTVTTLLRGTTSGLVCPDEAGRLEIEFEGEASATSGTTQVRHQFSGTATAQFDDNGQMVDGTIDMDVQANRTDAAGRSSFIDQTVGVRGGYEAGSVLDTTSTPTRASSGYDPSNSDDLQMSVDAAVTALRFVNAVMAARRINAQSNGCVIVEASPPSSVAPAQVVPFEVRTKHVVEGVPLDKRVDATLAGDGSIDPSTLPATPDSITYTAGEQAGDEGTITLVSRSRRGIGTTTVTIKVAPSYRVDQAAGVLRLQGPVCDIAEPFTLNVTGDLPGSLTFSPGATAPGGAVSGSFSGTGTSGPGTIEWGGTYSIAVADGADPVITMTDGGSTLSPGGLAVPAGNFWDGIPVLLVPDAGACG